MDDFTVASDGADVSAGKNVLNGGKMSGLIIHDLRNHVSSERFLINNSIVPLRISARHTWSLENFQCVFGENDSFLAHIEKNQSHNFANIHAGHHFFEALLGWMNRIRIQNSVVFCKFKLLGL